MKRLNQIGKAVQVFIEVGQRGEAEIPAFWFFNGELVVASADRLGSARMVALERWLSAHQAGSGWLLAVIASPVPSVGPSSLPTSNSALLKVTPSVSSTTRRFRNKSFRMSFQVQRVYSAHVVLPFGRHTSDVVFRHLNS